MNNNGRQKPSFQMSADSRFLYQYLMTILIGGIASFKEMSQLIGREVNGGSSSLQTAIRACLRENSMVFASIRGVGYKRLTDVEIVDTGMQTIDHIRRQSRRGVRKMMAVNKFDELPNDKKLQHSARVSVLASLAEATTPKQLTKVERAIGTTAKQLPVAETLKLFSAA